MRRWKALARNRRGLCGVVCLVCICAQIINSPPVCHLLKTNKCLHQIGRFSLPIITIVHMSCTELLFFPPVRWLSLYSISLELPKAAQGGVEQVSAHLGGIAIQFPVFGTTTTQGRRPIFSLWLRLPKPHP